MNSDLQQKLADYQPNEDVKQLVSKTPILLLVGPTGAGKDSLKDQLLLQGKFHHIVSHTTRPPRINHGVLEQDGKEYHFIDMAAANNMLDNHEFIEAKIYSGNLYGTSVSEIDAAAAESKIAMTDVEVQGVAEYKALDTSVMAVFLLPPSFKIWQERLSRRYGDVVDANDSRLRLQTALEELNQLLTTDYYVAVINDDMQETLKEIQTIVQSEKHITVDEPAARALAKQLAMDIEQHLAS